MPVKRGRIRSRVRRSVPAWSYVGPFSPLLRYDGMGRLSRRARLPCDAHAPRARFASRTSITLPANSPCTILIRAGNVVRDDLTVDIPPLRRTPTARGRTGVDGRSAASGIQRRGTRLSSRYAADRKRPPRWRGFACGRPELGRRHRSGLCQVCPVQLDLQRSSSRICRNAAGTEVLRFVNHLTVRTLRA